MKKTIGLCMIVKDEAHVIERCLESVRALIDHWVIVDTGSSDDTVALIEKTLAGIPGFVAHSTFKDFGHNRSEALTLARPHADYTLVVDADDILEIASLPEHDLVADAYTLEVLDHGTSYKRPHLFANKLTWRYVGAVHEYPACAETAQPKLQLLESVVYRRLGGGARSINGDKFLRDAAILERALEEDPKNARNAFYLAQSYYDARDFERALAAYRRRVELGGWEEEVYHSRLRIAKSLEALGAPTRDVVYAYLEAFKHRPQRAESLCDLARYHRTRGDLTLSYLFAQAAAAIPKPNDILFVDDTVYEWRALDELAVAAAHVGDLETGESAGATLMDRESVPDGERDRIAKNLSLVRALRARLAA